MLKHILHIGQRLKEILPKQLNMHFKDMLCCYHLYILPRYFLKIIYCSLSMQLLELTVILIESNCSEVQYLPIAV